MNTIPGTTINKPTIRLIDEDGNAYAVLGKVSRALRKAGAPKEIIEKFQSEATRGDYNNLLYVVLQYVNEEIYEECDC